MPDIITPASSRSLTITAANNGQILDLGPGSSALSVGTFVIQFVPDVTCDYSAIIMGRVFGGAAKDAGAPFQPIPYRRVVLANVASDYNIVTTTVSGASMIQVPANWAVGLFIAITTGSCAIVSMDLRGNSTP